MKQIDPSTNRYSGTDWRILGELELSVGSETNGVVGMWLTEILSPLDLHEEFLNRLLKSAQDATERAFHVKAGVMFEHIHLLIFVPPERASRDKIWGFFRIEKIENATGGITMAAHAIEFYLYVEG